MKTYRIERKYEEKGTRGKIFHGGDFICESIERPKTGDHPCIPEGWYIAKRYNSPANKCIVWQLEDVPGKTNIQLHIANWPSELLGCIAPGKDIAISQHGEPGVIKSRLAFEEFMEMTADEESIAFQIVEAK